MNRERTVPIGRPLAGSTCYVLDDQRDLLPVGAVGELYVGGTGLSLGYTSDTARTADRFVEHPFRAGERLYRTGDRVRWRWDGQLEFLGRADRQLKLRGHPIELKKIEHVLLSHEAVSSCAVMLDTTRVGDPRLVAYVSLGSGPLTTVQSLVEHRRRLPPYMVPAALIELPALPLHGEWQDRSDRSGSPRAGRQ